MDELRPDAFPTPETSRTRRGLKGTESFWKERNYSLSVLEPTHGGSSNSSWQREEGECEGFRATLLLGIEGTEAKPEGCQQPVPSTQPLWGSETRAMHDR